MRKILKKKSKNAEKATEDQKNGKNIETAKDPSDESEEENYEVQKIIDTKIENNVCFYLIRWKGYSSEDDTWEAEDKIDAPDAITAFKKRNDKTADKRTPKKKDDDIYEAENKGEASESHSAIKKIDNKTSKKKSPPKKRGNSSGKRSASSDKEEEWEVAKIVDMVEKDEETGERLFRIRWKGFAAKNDTWEPESNLSCEDLIQKYLLTGQRSATKDIEPKDLRDNRKTTDRYEPNNFAGRASRRQHGKIRKVYYDAE